MEKTVKCPICGSPYKIYPYYAGDQSACPDCVYEAEQKEFRKMNRPPQFNGTGRVGKGE